MKLIGILSSTVQAVLPDHLQFCFLEQQQILSLKQTQSYLTLVKQTPMAKNGLLWWVNNLELCNGQLVTKPLAQVFTRTDASKKRLGCILRDQNRESVVQEGTGSTYQSAGIFNHKVCHLDICQNMENVTYTYPDRQHDSLELFAENWRKEEYRTNADLKGNFGVSTWAGDHDYCRTFTKESQLQCRLGISAPGRFIRLDTLHSNFQQNMPNFGEETRNRPVCFKVVKSTSKLLLLEVGSQQSWHRCSSIETVSQESICIPSICLDLQSTEKSRGGESAFSNNSNSNLANPKVVPRTLTSFSEKSNHFAIKGRLTKGSSKPTASSYPKSNNAISSVGYLRKHLAEEGIPERAPDLIVSLRREGTLSTSSLAGNKWVS